MKRRWMLALMAIFVLSMAGCGNKEDVTETDTVVEEVPEVEMEMPEVTTETVTEVATETDEASSIVLEEGYPDEVATAVMYYYFEKELNNADGEVVGSVSYMIPQITLRSMSAAAINQDILMYFEEALAYAEDTEFLSAEEWGSETPQMETSINYTLTYLGEDKVCFLMDGYEYTGGAHGMPFRTVMIYDMVSGERLDAEAVFAVDESTFAQIYTDAYADKMAETPDLYWDDATEIVAGLASFANASYYLTDTGVTFYQEPYMIAAYSEGYVEVEVPYETLPLKTPEVAE